MQLGIYGSKELFIKEYREMLAERLLSSATYATDKEARNLELLKTRFGEQSLGQCEVMLQDLKDSKRLNTNIQNRRGKAAAIAKNVCPVIPSTPNDTSEGQIGESNLFSPSGEPITPPFVQNFSPFGQGQRTPAAAAAAPSIGINNSTSINTSSGAHQENEQPSAPAQDLVPLQALILSRYFWPTSLQDDSVKFNLPARIQTSLEEYESRYKEIKASRKLTWRKDLGLVDMTVQLKDRATSKKCASNFIQLVKEIMQIFYSVILQRSELNQS